MAEEKPDTLDARGELRYLSGGDDDPLGLSALLKRLNEKRGSRGCHVCGHTKIVIHGPSDRMAAHMVDAEEGSSPEWIPVFSTICMNCGNIQNFNQNLLKR